MLDRRRILLNAGASGSPIEAIGNLEAWWNREGIDPSATLQGNSIATWTDAVAGRQLQVAVGTPTLNFNNGLREVRFDGGTMMYIDEWPNVDFTPRVDEFSIIVKVGQTVTGPGTLIGKNENGSINIHYQINAQGASLLDGQIGHHVGTGGAGDSYFARGARASGGWEPNAVASLTVGTSTTDTTAYYNNEILTYDFYTNISNLTVGPNSNNFRITIGARRNDADNALGYAFIGDISHVLIYSKKLTSQEIATVVANLD